MLAGMWRPNQPNPARIKISSLYVRMRCIVTLRICFCSALLAMSNYTYACQLGCHAHEVSFRYAGFDK